MSKIPSESSVQPWRQETEVTLSPLECDINPDILVIGAGISGLTTAYFLAKEGRRVAVVDASPGAGEGETGNTSAHLSSALDERFYRLESLFGKHGARLAAESHRTAIDAIEAICREEGIACDFERVDGYLFAAKTEHNELLVKELEAARRVGLTVSMDDCSLPFTTYDTPTCLRFADQAQFQPHLYIHGLVTALRRMGVPLFGNCEVVGIEGHSPFDVQTASGCVISARELVVATNTPFNDRVAIHSKQAAYRSYALAFAIPNGVIPKALYWDTEEPYHYVRVADIDEEQSILIVGGEDHKVGQNEDPEVAWSRLLTWARRHIPSAGEVLKRWSGQVMEPVDGLAYIGRNPRDPHIYIVTGDSGHGLTHGTIAGLLISDLIVGNPNPWERLYSPSRINISAASLKEYFKENLNVAIQYRDWFSSGEVSSLNDIRPGDGAIVRDGLRKVAAYRDEAGALHCVSAVCPHLGALVHWNGAEKSWDCPCHGSRFDTKGQVINGPATTDLKAINPSEPKPHDGEASLLI